MNLKSFPLQVTLFFLLFGVQAKLQAGLDFEVASYTGTVTQGGYLFFNGFSQNVGYESTYLSSVQISLGLPAQTDFSNYIGDTVAPDNFLGGSTSPVYFNFIDLTIPDDAQPGRYTGDVMLTEYQGGSNFPDYPTFQFTFTVLPSSTVPEPSSLVLCGIAGLVGLAYARTRRERDA